MRTELTYYLPLTQARLRATMLHLTDDLEPAKNTTEVSSWSADLLTVADTTQARTLAVESGLLRDYGLKLTLAEDGRLASASLESTGQLGTVLASAAGLATSIAAATVFHLPIPTPVPAVPPVVTKGGQPTTDNPPPALSPVEERYLNERPDDAQQLAALQGEYAMTRAKVTEARSSYLQASDARRVDAWNHYRRATRLMADVSEELTRAKALFDAWRRSKQTTTESVDAVTVPVSALPEVTMAQDGTITLTWGTGDQAESVQQFFDRTEHVLARKTGIPQGSPTTPTEPNGDASLRVRRPRSVGLACVRRDKSGALWLIDDRRELIMDSECDELRVPVRKSWFARRKTAVELSTLGALTGLELGGSSSAAAAGAALTGAASSTTAALESAQKARASLTTLAAADAEDELARLKRETAISEQRLLAAGQAATASDFARLEWLKQQVAIAEARAKLGGSS